MLEKIKEKCRNDGIIFDNDNRVLFPEMNLIRIFPNWKQIMKEIGKGQGSELKIIDGKRPKFNSIYSSSCLCVNNFALIKEKCSNISIFNYGPFQKAIFEEKLPTGISCPNIDFYLESEEVIIGIESKYTEILSSKIPNWKDNKGIGNLSKYKKREKEIKYIPAGFIENIIDYYCSINTPYYLDVAQLVKHTLGLIRGGTEKGKKKILVYIYWEPNNVFEYENYEKHKSQIEEFSKKISEYIIFKSISYKKFWEQNQDNDVLSLDIQMNREKYEL